MKTPLSNCCKKPVFLYSGDEGTNHYECTGCKKDCDAFTTGKASASSPKTKPDTLLLRTLDAKLSIIILLLTILAFSALGLLLK